MTDYDKWLNWLVDIENNGVNLNAWEETFVADLRTKFDRFGNRTILSERQAEQLERIYTERTP